MGELDIYERILPDDSVAPKQSIKQAVKYIRDEQRKIAEIRQKSQMMQQRFQQFLMEDPDGQASQIADAKMQLMQQAAAAQSQK